MFYCYRRLLQRFSQELRKVIHNYIREEDPDYLVSWLSFFVSYCCHLYADGSHDDDDLTKPIAGLPSQHVEPTVSVLFD